MKLFEKDTRAIIFGRQAIAAQGMLDFDFVSKREIPSIVCFVSPDKPGFERLFFGSKEMLFPVYKTISEAVKKHPDATVMVNFAPSRFAYQTTVDTINTENIKTIAIIAEGVPERETRSLSALAKEKGKVIIGPATVGGVIAGKFKIGNAGGTTENIINSKLYQPGSVGLVTKSGGMLNEMFNMIARNTDGAYEGIAIGGDRYPCSSLVDHLLRLEEIPEVKFLVMLGEVGGLEEYKVVEALKQGKIKKPLVAWVTGTCSKIFPTEVQFGHAGARAGNDEETADSKNKALKESGAIISNSFDDLPEQIKKTYEELKSKGIIQQIEEFTPREIPMDYETLMKQGLIRKHAEFINTIADERGELSYSGVPITKIIKEKHSIGYAIGLLWLQKKLPEYASEFIELLITVFADHGPCVSGAHNTMVAARAGKDLVSSVTSGLLTMGPRYGAAQEESGRYYLWARENGLTPQESVDYARKKHIALPGFGHKVKSTKNIDWREKILIEFTKKNFSSTEYLDYCLEMEKVTTKISDKFIFNIGGISGALWLDLLKSLGYTDEEVKELVEDGILTSINVLARTIGYIGHHLEQNRLKENLYRVPYDDVLYWLPDEKDL
jgi:ATP-citrate lyase alpha-subunit